MRKTTAHLQCASTWFEIRSAQSCLQNVSGGKHCMIFAIGPLQKLHTARASEKLHINSYGKIQRRNSCKSMERSTERASTETWQKTPPLQGSRSRNVPVAQVSLCHDDADDLMPGGPPPAALRSVKHVRCVRATHELRQMLEHTKCMYCIAISIDVISTSNSPTNP